VSDPIPVRGSVVVPAEALSMKAVRSGGPGGQNVNKVSSKVQLRVDLDAIEGIDADALARLRVLAANKLDADGHLLVMSDTTRDQPKNLDEAREKVRVLVESALVVPKRRKKTKPGRGAIERRIAEKKHVAAKKQNRRAES
jgi:ribosome-associated protein